MSIIDVIFPQSNQVFHHFDISTLFLVDVKVNHVPLSHTLIQVL